ncbi:MAG: CheR family methyltransferase [Thiogranum sp.]
MADTSGQAPIHANTRPGAGCSLDMDDRQFSDWTRLLESRTGLFISPERKSFLVSGIRSRMREVGCQDYREYYRHLSGRCPQVREWSLLVDELTVHETCFFRHESSMKLVEDAVIPYVFEHRQGLNAWSVGCATGEESYSLAMLFDNYCAEHVQDGYFGVTGTDISLPSLHHAREGLYLERRLQGIPPEFREKYCRPESSRRFRIAPDLRKRVCFSRLNLRDVEKAPFANLDLVFCQNLLIYYDRERRLQIVNRLAECLRPAGVLVLGPGELLDWRHPEMERVRYPDTLAYRRTD